MRQIYESRQAKRQRSGERKGAADDGRGAQKVMAVVRRLPIYALIPFVPTWTYVYMCVHVVLPLTRARSASLARC